MCAAADEEPEAVRTPAKTRLHFFTKSLNKEKALQRERQKHLKLMKVK